MACITSIPFHFKIVFFLVSVTVVNLMHIAIRLLKESPLCRKIQYGLALCSRNLVMHVAFKKSFQICWLASMLLN